MVFSEQLNADELRHEGVTVLSGLFDKRTVANARRTVLENRGLFKNTRSAPSSGHLAGFHRFPALEPLHTLLTGNQHIIDFLGHMQKDGGVRSIGLSDITINRSQHWHKDLLRGQYKTYLDGVLDWEADGGGVYKVLLYLQDSASLKYIEASHTIPVSLDSDHSAEPAENSVIKTAKANAGDVVIMDIRCSHRGASDAAYADGQWDENPRILVSTVLGGVARKLTGAMERGNFHRLSDWMNLHP